MTANRHTHTHTSFDGSLNQQQRVATCIQFEISFQIRGYIVSTVKKKNHNHCVDEITVYEQALSDGTSWFIWHSEKGLF